MQVLVNPHCAGGRGGRKWQVLAPSLQQRYPGIRCQIIPEESALQPAVIRALHQGERTFIAGGGDGTVNRLLNVLLNAPANNAELTLGAIGLGSSNDFHKPFRAAATLQGVPLRIDSAHSYPCDVIQIRCFQDGQMQQTYGIINASIGIAARANARYNSRGRLLRAIQQISVDAAILLSVLRTIATYHNFPCRITQNQNAAQEYRLTNLGVIKNPHFGGQLCYDTPVACDDGWLAVNLCEGMSRLQTLGILGRLYRHHFAGRPHTASWQSTRLTVSSARQFDLEIDGEVLQTSNVEFRVLPQKIRCCA